MSYNNVLVDGKITQGNLVASTTQVCAPLLNLKQKIADVRESKGERIRLSVRIILGVVGAKKIYLIKSYY